MRKKQLIQLLQQSVEAFGDGEVFIEDSDKPSLDINIYRITRVHHDKVHGEDRPLIITF